jgi:hypothetical protein
MYLAIAGYKEKAPANAETLVLVEPSSTAVVRYTKA